MLVVSGISNIQCQAADGSGVKGDSQVVNVPSEKSRFFVKDGKIVLQVLKHEQGLFDWHPDFMLNVPSFDSRNLPYIRSRTNHLDVTGFVHTLRDGKWEVLDFIDDIKAAFPTFVRTVRAAGWYQSRIVFDENDFAYTLVEIMLKDKTTRNLLLYSRNYCRDWQIFELPSGNFAIEHAADPTPVSNPPVIFIWTKRAEHPSKWASFNSLRLIVPKTSEQGLELGEPILLSDNFLGFTQHSGGSSYAVTRGNKTHLVWGEATDKRVSGVPTYVASYDRKMDILGEKVFLAYAPPINDVHNTPGICIDSKGYLHVITGAHGRNFLYLRSKKANDVYGGWTKPKRVLTSGCVYENGKQKGRQAYLAFACDGEDTLHIVYRQYRQGVDDYHQGRDYRALSYQRKKKNGLWEEARPMVIPPMAGYSTYYHKLAIDRRGNLYLSYSYWSPANKYKSLKGLYNFRSMIYSADGGDTWDLVVTKDFIQGILN